MNISDWLAEAEKRCAAATPGPWVVPVANVFRVIALGYAGSKWKPVRGIVEAPEEHFHFGADDLAYRDEDNPAADAAFIAHARADMPRALGILIEMQGAFSALRAGHIQTHGEFDDSCDSCLVLAAWDAAVAEIEETA